VGSLCIYGCGSLSRTSLFWKKNWWKRIHWSITYPSAVCLWQNTVVAFLRDHNFTHFPLSRRANGTHSNDSRSTNFSIPCWCYMTCTTPVVGSSKKMYNINKDLVMQHLIESIASWQWKSNNNPTWKKCQLEKWVISVDYKVYTSEEIQIESNPISFG